jgi:hypothetical protein
MVPAILYFLFYQYDPKNMSYEAVQEYQAKAKSFLKIFGLIWLAATLIYSYSKERPVFYAWWILPVIGVLSYSLYFVIFIRAGLHPPINENDPSTLQGMKEYLGRNQYGNEDMVLTFLYRKAEFWHYQVQMMYTRYFGWQFIGKGTTMDAQDRIVEIISFRGLYGIPFLVGLWGMIYHFMKDWKRALAVLVVFFITGYAIILYLNQPDPQPRERDYSYIGSFFAFALWIGIGMAALLEWISLTLKNKPLLKKIVYAATVILLVAAVPVNLLAFNYHEHSRAGNYVASDYSYNILETCEPNAIIFTNGDNDTFPLWYLQEVEGIRKDVRIVNLSLLNTAWYIKQLRDEEPKVPINLSDQAIESLGPMPWKAQDISIPVPPDVRQKARKELGDTSKVQVPDKIVFKVNPTFKATGVQGIRVQDLMVMQILYANQWKRPVYYAVTVSSDNMIGLMPYFRMDGLAFKILPYKPNEIEGKTLEDNLLKKYRYRNLNNPKVYNDLNILKLLQNYRSAFYQLAQYYLERKSNADAIRVLDEMTKIMPETVIPYSDERAALYLNEIYRRAGKQIDINEQLRHIIPNQPESRQDMFMLARYYAYNMQDWDSAERILRQLIQYDRNDVEAFSDLLRVFSLSKQHQKSADLLEEYLLSHPQDTSATNELSRLKRSLAASEAQKIK